MADRSLGSLNLRSCHRFNLEHSRESGYGSHRSYELGYVAFGLPTTAEDAETRNTREVRMDIVLCDRHTRSCSDLGLV